jgi:hypothetical protein
MTYVLPQYDRSLLSPDEQEMFDRVVSRQSRSSRAQTEPNAVLGDYFGVLMHAPRIADLLSALGRYMRSRGETGTSFSHADSEWVSMVLSSELASPSVALHHLRSAVAVGVRPEAIQALLAHRERELTPAERQLTEYIRAVVHGSVTEELFAAIVRRFGVRGAVEYTVCITWLAMTIRNTQAFGSPRVSRETVEGLLARILAGTEELPDPRELVSSLDAAAI